MISDYAVTGANGVGLCYHGRLIYMTNSFAMDYALWYTGKQYSLGISLSAMGDIIADEMEDEEVEEFWVRTQMIPRRGRVQEVAILHLSCIRHGQAHYCRRLL